MVTPCYPRHPELVHQVPKQFASFLLIFRVVARNKQSPSWPIWKQHFNRSACFFSGDVRSTLTRRSTQLPEARLDRPWPAEIRGVSFPCPALFVRSGIVRPEK